VGIGPVLARFADLPQAQLPWERHLRRLLVKAVSQVPRLSHRRPAGRFLAREAQARQTGGPSPAFEPGQTRDGKRARIVVGLDTSSSITDLQVDLFAAELLQVGRKSGAELTLLAFDTEVHLERTIAGPSDLAGQEIRRGGGTDFAPVMERAAGLAPSALVMLTDLDAPLGPAPATPLIWAVPTAPEIPPAYGTLLVMDR
jgi:predicted metal-dependent peptidase